MTQVYSNNNRNKRRRAPPLLFLGGACLFLLTTFGWPRALDAQPCPAGDYVLTTQTEVDAFPAGCTDLAGMIIIGPSTDIVNLNGLSGLVTIGGILRIDDNPGLTNVDGLASLTTVGTLIIENNRFLENVDGLSSLTSADIVTIYFNCGLQDVDGLSNLAQVDMALEILNNDALTNLDGLSGLESVMHLVVAFNPVLTRCNCGLFGLMTTGGVSGTIAFDHNAPTGNCNDDGSQLMAACLQGCGIQRVLSSTDWKSADQFFAGWEMLAFDDSGWPAARAPYPNPVPPGDKIPGTNAEFMWHNPDGTSNGQTGPSQAFFRRSVDIPAGTEYVANALVQADDDFDLYVNGVLAFSDDNDVVSVFTDAAQIDLAPLLRTGENVLAIRATDRVGGYEWVLFDAALEFFMEGPPVCELVQSVKGPPRQLIIRVSDDGSGLADIQVVQDLNAAVDEPAFTLGTTEPQIVTVTKIDPDKKSVIELKVIDVAGNVTTCDPVVTRLTAEIAEGYELEQSYPNPFNPTTNIEFAIPEASFVQLRVFDAVGREVAALVNEEMQPGTYSVNWDATNSTGDLLPSGLYFYRIEAGDFSATRSMLFIK